MIKLFKITLFIIIIFSSITYAANNYDAGSKKSIVGGSQELFEDFSIDISDALIYLEKEIERDPENYRLRFVLGILYFDLGIIKYDPNTKRITQANLIMLHKAEEEFNEVLKINENESLAYYYLGLVSMQRASKKFDIEQATEYFEKAIECDKHNRKAYLKLHTLYLVEKRYNDAIILFEKAKNIFKFNVENYHRLSVSYLFIQNYEKVIENAKKAISLVKNTESQLVLASAYSVTGDYDNAKLQLEDVLSKDPKNRTALLGLSVVFKRKGDKEKSVKILKKALEYYPNDDEIKGLLKEMTIERKK